MRRPLLQALRCPRCRISGDWRLEEQESDVREIRTGTATCGGCGREATIRHGVVDLLHDPPPYVVAEADGLARFADVMRRDGWTAADVVALPVREDGYWWVQKIMLDQVLETVPMPPGTTILDLGSNTCWATAAFAARGLQAIALDIADHEMQGLCTADWQFAAKDVYFERVLGLMFDLPFADASFDVVWACQVLHHNHRANLAATFREAFRVLRPGGRLVVVNEPLRTVLHPNLRPGEEVAEFDGHEHAFTRLTYTRLARRAGFTVEVRGPRIHGIFQEENLGIGHRMSLTQIVRAASTVAARKSPLLKQAVLAARTSVVGRTALHMVCTKPWTAESPRRRNTDLTFLTASQAAPSYGVTDVNDRSHSAT